MHLIQNKIPAPDSQEWPGDEQCKVMSRQRPPLPFPSALHPEEEALEAEHYAEIQTAFRLYAHYHQRRIDKYIRDYEGLCEEDRRLLHGYRTRLNKVAASVKCNQDVFNEVANSGDASARISAIDDKMESLRSLLRQVARDWSTEGRDERQLYIKILSRLSRYLPRGKDADLRVLVPGAGLGRLAYEIAARGYETQGCEFSLFMLLMSEHILNHGKPFVIYPYLFPFSNLEHGDHQLASVMIPDIAPSLSHGSQFSMLAGDFTHIYRHQEACWDAIVTCFFMDTAKNIVDYVRLIGRLLKPGGIWVNAGPLQWHWDNTPDEVSIELTLDELRKLVVDLGLTFLEEETHESAYAQHRASMHQSYYRCSLMVIQRQAHLSPK